MFVELFHQATKDAQHHLGLLAVLAWVAACDGDISPEEITLLSKLGGSDISKEAIQSLVSAGAECDVEALHLAVEAIKSMPTEHRIDVLTLALGMTLADGKMTFAEAAILRFLEDAWSLPVSTLQRVFKDSTGKELPAVSDPSNPEYYFGDKNEKRNSSRAEERNDHINQQREKTKQPRRPTSNMSHSEAVKILGMNAPFTQSDVRSSYIRLAKVHHPDKFESMDEDMKKAATIIFAKIQTAYDLLCEAR